MKKNTDELREARALILDLLNHLDYIGWGDAWEREVSEGLQERAEEYTKKHCAEAVNRWQK